MTVSFILAPSAALANEVNANVTIEAEYGSVVAEGTVYTAAHHQAGMEHLPAPCNDQNIPVLDDGTVLVSHLDLDTFGGCLRTLASSNDLFNGNYQSFWNLAHFVDINGAHKLGQSGANDLDLLRLHAFWAWKRANVPYFSRDEVTDVSTFVSTAGDILRKIFAGDDALMDAGRKLIEDTKILNKNTFKDINGNVVVRVTDEEKGFCNHLYNTIEGQTFMAVAAYNKTYGTITVSLADPVEGVSCREVMQNLFGPEAGGHDGIAGSPREKQMTMEEFEQTANELSNLLR